MYETARPALVRSKLKAYKGRKVPCSAQFLQVSLSNESFHVSLSNIELAVSRQSDRPRVRELGHGRGRSVLPRQKFVLTHIQFGSLQHL